MSALRDALVVGAGGAAGTVLRALLEGLVPHLPGAALVVLSINLLGAYLIGFGMEVFFQRAHSSGRLRLALTTGALGGFTTFGGVMEQAAAFMRDGLFAPAALVGFGEPVVGVLLTLLGQGSARLLLGRR